MKRRTQTTNEARNPLQLDAVAGGYGWSSGDYYCFGGSDSAWDKGSGYQDCFQVSGFGGHEAAGGLDSLAGTDF